MVNAKILLAMALLKLTQCDGDGDIAIAIESSFCGLEQHVQLDGCNGTPGTFRTYKRQLAT